MFDTSSKNNFTQDYYYINDILLDDLVLDLNNDADDISRILTDIEMIMHDLDLDLKGNVYNVFSTKFNSYKVNIPKIKNNLQNYTKSLLSVKANYVNVDKDAAKIMLNASNDVNDKSQVIINKYS